MRQLFHALLTSLLLLTALSLGHAPLLAPSPVHADTPSITIKTKDFSYDAPDTLQTGQVTFVMTNEGKEPHQANIARLVDGKTLKDLTDALAQSPEAALGLLEFVGGPNTIMPGARQEVTINLDKAGIYVLLCFVPSADGVPHIAKGMMKSFEVTAASTTTTEAAPSVDRTVTLKDFMIPLPKEVQAGSYSWKVENEGPQPHELTLIKLAPGKTLADVVAFVQSPAGPPPYSDAGGVGALAAGRSNVATLTFEPGNYVALCFIPDPASGKAHAALGMVTPFTVVAASATTPPALPTAGAATPSTDLTWPLLGIGSLLLAASWLIRRRMQRST